MILEHCNRAACTQIIEALRAQVADFDAILDAKQSEVCELESQVAALTQEVFELRRDGYSSTEPEDILRSQLSAAQARIKVLREAADECTSVDDRAVILSMADELEAGK